MREDREAPTATDPDDPAEEALREYAEHLAAGTATDPEVFLAERPAVAERIRKRILHLRAAHEALLDFTTPHDRPALVASVAGRTLGGFRILREIGRGGMGVVYLAEETSLRRLVALKVLPAHVTLHRAAVERFRREASTAARLRHSGIIEIHAIGEHEGTHFFAMELIEGASLDRVLAAMQAASADAKTADLAAIVSATTRRVSDEGDRVGKYGASPPREEGRPARLPPAWGRSSIESICALVAGVAESLEHAHRAGVIHRDVKPSNILLRPDGSAVLTDFGLARDVGLPSMSQTGEFAGTPYYVSPEQAQARRLRVDHRTDVFSLGVTLYELLTLRRPFDGRSSQEVLARIVAKEPPNPQSLNPRLAPDLVTIVLKAIEKDPERRYATAQAMADDLRAFLDYRPIAARRATPWNRLRRWIKREPLQAALAGVLILGVPVLAGLVGYVVARQPEIRAAREAARLERADTSLQEGFLELGEGNYDRALAAFERARAEDRRSTEAVGGTVLALLADGQAEQALATVDGHVATAENRAALDRLRVDALRVAGRAGDAAELESRLAEPTRPLELFLHGTREIQLGEQGEPLAFERAVEHLLRAAFTGGRARPLYYFELSHAAGHAKDVATVRRCAEALIGLWPTSSTAAYWRGFMFQEIGELERSMPEFRRAVEITPGFVTAHYRLASALREAGDIDGAVDEYRRSIALQPSFAAAHYGLAQMLLQSHDLAGAMEEYRHTLALDPDHAEARCDLGSALLGAGDLVGALAELRRTVEIEPRLVPAHANLALALQYSGDSSGAIAEFRRAIELAATGGVMPVPLTRTVDRQHQVGPAKNGTYASLHHNLGRALLEAGDSAEAIVQYRRALELEPDSAMTHSALGVALRRTGDIVGGLAALRRAVAIEPGDLAYRYNLAVALHDEGDLAEAITGYRRALEIEPTSPEVHLALGMALEATGDHAGVRAECERWTQVQPDDAQAWNALAWLLLDPNRPHEQRDLAAGLAAALRAADLSHEQDPSILDTLAEARFLHDEIAAAIALEERALALLDGQAPSDGSLRASLLQSLARFRAAATESKCSTPKEDP